MPDRPTGPHASAETGHDELDRLRQKHQRCEHRLSELRGRLFPTEDEKREEVNLKKQKLLLKDRMETIVRETAEGGVPDPR